MAEPNMTQRKISNTKLKLSDLNPHLMCVLCGGYYIDATTIVECLHSFCRSCIVKHLESSKYCPICEVQVHKTKPLINIRPDKTLQDIVYKLVPGLFTNEMRNRRKFYKERPHYIKPSDSESSGEVSAERKIYVNDENITFSLVYHVGPAPSSTEHSFEEFSPPVQNEKRYFKCPTGVTVYHLKKLLRAKYDLNENSYKFEIYFRDQEVHDDFTLLDIAYIYLWKTKGSLDLTYKIFENVIKRRKIGETVETAKETGICESGSLTESAEEKKVGQEQEKYGGGGRELTENKEDERDKEGKPNEETLVPEKLKIDESLKKNGMIENEVKEVQLQISESGVMSVSQVDDGEIVRTVEESAPKSANNEIITGLKLDRGVKGREEVEGENHPQKEFRPGTERKSQAKSTKPYKTIRCPPKTWHPVIAKEKLRPTLMKNSDEPKRPLKFFKMRNMPRVLGNPSSGVKPMYAQASEDKKPEERKPDPIKSLNKILKIDPKTLRPIEKEDVKVNQTPSAPNLLTNPFIPNNNHFLFSDLHLLPPNSGGSFNKYEGKEKAATTAATATFKNPVPNGSYPPICFPASDHPPGFYPLVNLTKPQGFPFSVTDKMDPLLRASRLSPFGSLADFNVAGIHASLPPSISRLLNPHHHFRKISQSFETKKGKEESTKEMAKNCDDSVNASNGREETKSNFRGSKVAHPECERNKKQQQEKEEFVCATAPEEGRDGAAAATVGKGVGVNGDDGSCKPEVASVTEPEKDRDR